MSTRMQSTAAGPVEQKRSRPPILRRVAAGLVLVAVAALIVHFVIGLLMTVVYVALIVGVVLAVVWALKTIVW